MVRTPLMNVVVGPRCCNRALAVMRAVVAGAAVEGVVAETVRLAAPWKMAELESGRRNRGECFAAPAKAANSSLLAPPRMWPRDRGDVPAAVLSPSADSDAFTEAVVAIANGTDG